jgi:hypothetical protein
MKRRREKRGWDVNRVQSQPVLGRCSGSTQILGLELHTQKSLCPQERFPTTLVSNGGYAFNLSQGMEVTHKDR